MIVLVMFHIMKPSERLYVQIEENNEWAAGNPQIPVGPLRSKITETSFQKIQYHEK